MNFETNIETFGKLPRFVSYTVWWVFVPSAITTFKLSKVLTFFYFISASLSSEIINRREYPHVPQAELANALKRSWICSICSAVAVVLIFAFLIPTLACMQPIFDKVSFEIIVSQKFVISKGVCFHVLHNRGAYKLMHAVYSNSKSSFLKPKGTS